jgi:FdhE protein
MSTDYETEKRHLEKKLQKLKELDYIPDEMLELLSKVANRQLAAREEADVAAPADGDLPASDKHALGAPLLPANEFGFDAGQYKELFKEFLGFMEESGGTLQSAAALIREDMENGGLDLDDVAKRFLAADQDYFEQRAQRTPDAPSSLSFLVQAALSPSFEALGRRLKAKHDADAIWNHGTCPVCGSLPLIGRIKTKEGARHLTCAFCHTEYRAPRIACPYCGETKQEKLQFFDSPEEPGYRVETCKSCKMYIKTVDFRDMDRISQPLLDDLESLAMDILARQEGYTRPTVSGWGF